MGYRHRMRRLYVLFLTAASIVYSGARSTPSAQTPSVRVIAPNHHDVSPPLSAMPDVPATMLASDEDFPNGIHPLPTTLPPTDPATMQTEPGVLAALTPGLNLLGVGKGFPSFTVTGDPPDPNGAVGATQYVQWVNTSFAVFNKSTGVVVRGPVSANTLWQGFTDPCGGSFLSDPVVAYDKAANRWVMSIFAFSGRNGDNPIAPFYECVAVSQTSDATGAYNRYSYNFDNDFVDYPKLGVWPDAYYFSFNRITRTFNAATVCAIDRAAALNGGQPDLVCIDDLFGSTSGTLYLPSDWDGATPPPAGSPNFYVGIDSDGQNLDLLKFHVDFANPNNSTFGPAIRIPVSRFNANFCFDQDSFGRCVPQPGDPRFSVPLFSLAERIMFRLAYRNFGTHESMVVTHSVAVNGDHLGVRWYEVRDPNGTPVVFQQGTYAPDSDFRWMGSISMDQMGDMLMGYSVSSKDTKPSIRVTGRENGDRLGRMTLAETSVMTGGGVQGTARWGDYSAVAIDPVDDCTFWYTSMYLPADGQDKSWSTRIASLRFPVCGTFTVSAAPSTITIAPGASDTVRIRVRSLDAFSGSTDIAVTGLPAGVTATFDQNPVTPPPGDTATSTVTLTVPATTALGTFNVSVSATSGEVTHTTNLTLSIRVPTCTFSIAPASNAHRSNGGGGNINVSTQPGCSWTAVSNVPWVTVTSGSAVGSGTAFYSVDPNPDATPRSGTITIGTQTFTVNEDRLIPNNASLSLAGGLHQFVRVPNHSTLDLTGPFTVEAWIENFNADGLPQQSIVERYHVTGTEGGFALRLVGGKLAFQIMNNGRIVGIAQGTTPLSGGWHHVAGVWDGSQLHLYVDGTVEALEFASAGPSSGTADLEIGARGDDGAALFFDGFVDEVRLTAAVLYTSNFGPEVHLDTVTGTRGLWTFNNQTATDSSGNGNNGALINGARFNTNEAPEFSSVLLDGIESYVQIPDTPTLSVDENFTLEAWVKTSSIAEQLIVSRGDTGGAYSLRLLSGNQLSFSVSDGSTADSVTSATSLSTGIWHHVAGVAHGGQLRAFVDGVERGVKSTSIRLGAVTGALRIGAALDGTRLFTGFIDEVRLTSRSVYASDFNPDARLAAVVGTAALWRFDRHFVWDASLRGNQGAFFFGAGMFTDVPPDSGVAPQSTDFTLGVSPAALTVAQSGSGTTAVTVSSVGGFSAATSLSVSGLPSGVTASFSSSSVTPPAGGGASSVLTLSASSTATPATFVLNVTGVAGALSHTTPLTLTVTGLPASDFSLGATPSSITMAQSGSASTTVVVGSINGFSAATNLSVTGLPSGVTAAFSPSTVIPPSGGAGLSQLSLTASSTAATGVFSVNVVGSSGVLSHAVSLGLTVTLLPTPDFTLAASPGSLAVAKNSSGSATVTASSLNGFSGTTSLSVSGLPSGVTASFAPASVTLPSGGLASSTLTLAVASSATAGTFPLTITGTSGILTHTATLGLTVSGPVPDFTLGVSPSSINLSTAKGSTSSTTVTIGSLNGFNGATSLSVSMVPAGVAVSFTPATVTPPSGGSASSTLTLSVPVSTTAGTFTLKITGTAGSVNQTANVTLVLGAAPPADFNVGVSPASVSLNQGGSTATTVTVGSLNGFSSPTSLSISGVPSGVTSSFAPASVTPASGGSAASTLTLAASAAATPGTFTVNVTGISGGTSHSVSLTLTVVVIPSADFSIGVTPSSASVTAGASINASAIVTSLNGFNGLTSLSVSGAPAGVTTTFSPASVTPAAGGTAASTLTLTTSASATTGTFSLTITGVSGAMSHSAALTLTINPQPIPDFGLSVAPGSITMAPNSSGNAVVTVSSLNGFSGATSLSISGLPSGVTASFGPPSVTPSAGGSASSTLTLAVSSSASAGSFTLTIGGTSGSLSHTAALSLTVSGSSPDFTLSVSPGSIHLSAAKGSSSAATVIVGSLGGFSGATSLSLTGLPSGVAASFAPATVTPAPGGSASSTLTLSVPVSAPVGTFTVKITAAAGSTSHTVNLILTIP